MSKGKDGKPHNATEFKVGDKTYNVVPLSIAEVDEFIKDNLALGSQVFNLVNKDAREKLDKWLQRKARDASGNALNLQRVSEDGWDIRDLRRFLAEIADMVEH